MQTPGSPFGQPPNAAVPNSFPREYIAAGETVIYETRPSIVPFLIRGIIWLIIGLIITGAVASAGSAGADEFVGFIFVVLPLLSILLGYLEWTRTAYAITDKRTLQSHGIFSRATNDCAHNKVQLVILRQGIFDRIFGYGHIIFQTAGMSVTNRSAYVRGGGVWWQGVKDPVNTRRFIQEVTEYLARTQKAQEFQDMARVLQASGTGMPGVQAPPPPPMAPPAGAPPAPMCPRCGKPGTWVPQYNRYYCYTDQQYL
jgi:membrane protein YdbS with pleckstrin-like domain